MYLTGNVYAITVDDSFTYFVWFMQLTVKLDSSENVTDNHTVFDGAKYMMSHFLEKGNYQIN